MTVEQAESILLPTGISIAFQHRFAFDTGTVLRLDNYVIINIFDDGRYYLQAEDCPELVALFEKTEHAWDPTSWDGEIPRRPPSLS